MIVDEFMRKVLGNHIQFYLMPTDLVHEVTPEKGSIFIVIMRIFFFSAISYNGQEENFFTDGGSTGSKPLAGGLTQKQVLC
jgi:hypothetical protein